MKLVIFGLTVSSSWGNGHATLWRGLFRALIRRGHQVVFFERDVPYYAQHRDLTEIPGVRLVLYDSWETVLPLARQHLTGADVGMVTSYCPDGVVASNLVLASNARIRVFYDLDTPVTLDHVRAGRPVNYLPPYGLGDFDLVLSYTGGRALDELKTMLGARCVAPLYGSVDPEAHFPVEPKERFRSDLSYLGTYAEDRQSAVEAFFVEPARRLPHYRFMIGGALYPVDFPWTGNIYFVRHLEPSLHSAFYCSSRFTLNVTRRAMAQSGFCPSGRLFEAAACGVAVISDWWVGLDTFFDPWSEVVIARSTEHVIQALELSSEESAEIGRRARERVLAGHTADHRVTDLEAALELASGPVVQQPDSGSPISQPLSVPET